MSKMAELIAFEVAVDGFMRREGLNNLSYVYDDDGEPDETGILSRCECCKSPGGVGSTWRANGWSERDGEVREYDRICEDCLYYAEYGYRGDMDNLEAEKDEPIREWEDGKFKLKMWEADDRIPNRVIRNYLAYRFWYDGKEVFKGADYAPDASQTDDGDEAVAGLLHFLSLKPGDTDSEYFDSYTTEQMQFAILHGEELGTIARDMEDGSYVWPELRRYYDLAGLKTDTPVEILAVWVDEKCDELEAAEFRERWVKSDD